MILMKIKGIVHVMVAVMAMIPGAAKVDRHENLCLAKAIYHEVRGEDLDSRVAIATFMVDFAERNDKTICQEIAAPGRYPWYGKKKIYEMGAWEDAVVVATRTLQGEMRYDVNDATHFLMPKTVLAMGYDLPKWYYTGEHVAKVGEIVFIKTPDYS